MPASPELPGSYHWFFRNGRRRCQVKTMETGEQVKVNVAEAADYMAKNL